MIRGCPTSIDEQILSLQQLAPGWFDGDGFGYEQVQLNWLSELLNEMVIAFQLPTPYIYPTPERNMVTAEWSMQEWEVGASIDLTKLNANISAVNVGSYDIHELSLDLSKAGSESQFGRFVADYL